LRHHPVRELDYYTSNPKFYNQNIHKFFPVEVGLFFWISHQDRRAPNPRLKVIQAESRRLMAALEILRSGRHVRLLTDELIILWASNSDRVQFDWSKEFPAIVPMLENCTVKAPAFENFKGQYPNSFTASKVRPASLLGRIRTLPHNLVQPIDWTSVRWTWCS
jgi:hypothetical protein